MTRTPNALPLPTRRWVLGTGLIATLALGLSACQREPASVIEKLTIAEAGTLVMGLLYVAQDRGFFRDEGLEVTFQRHASGRDSIEAVFEGKADLATPYDGPAVININSGKPLRVLGALGVSPGETVVLARKDRGIATVTDLRGKRIGIIANSNPEYLLSLLLRSTGVQLPEVVRVPLLPAETATALIEGRVDAIASWVPHWQVAQSQLGTDATLIFTSDSYVEFATLSTSAEVLQARPRAIDKAVRALVKAESYVAEHPTESLKIIETALAGKFPPDVLKERWARTILQLRLDNRIAVSLQNEAEWFANHAGIGQAPDSIRSYLAPEPLRKVSPQSVTLPVEP